MLELQATSPHPSLGTGCPAGTLGTTTVLAAAATVAPMPQAGPAQLCHAPLSDTATSLVPLLSVAGTALFGHFFSNSKKQIFKSIFP